MGMARQNGVDLFSSFWNMIAGPTYASLLAGVGRQRETEVWSLARALSGLSWAILEGCARHHGATERMFLAEEQITQSR